MRTPTDPPLVSVILPVPDRSASGTVPAWAKDMPDVELLRVPADTHAGNMARARNAGLAQARGKYTAFLEPGADYLPGALQARLDYLERRPDADLVHSPTHLRDAAGNDLGAVLSRPRDMSFEAAMNPVDLNGVMGKTDLFRRIGFDADAAWNGEWLFFARLLRSGAISHFVLDGGATLRLNRAPSLHQERERHRHATHDVLNWIYTQCLEPRTAPRYRQALASPPRAAATRLHDLAFFIWCLVSGNTHVCRELMESGGFVAFLNAYTVVFFKEAIQTQIARHHQVKSNDAPDALDTGVRSAMVKNAISLGLLARAPSMMLALCECLGLDYPAATKEWIPLGSSVESADAAQHAALIQLTTFRSDGDPADVRNCVGILLKNCGNPYLRSVHVLLEGDPGLIEKCVDTAHTHALRSHLASGKLRFAPIAGRPDYKTILDYANTLGRGTVAVTNADVVIPEQAALDITRGRAAQDNPVYALTHWNRTASGDYLQGLQAHPPWPQWSANERCYFERHCLSYDCYIFDTPLEVPQALESVSVATYGCDTAMAAILRTAGYEVRNPCLSVKTVHIDDKLRDYAGERGQRDLANNIQAFKSQLVRRYADDEPALSLLQRLGCLSKPLAWLGGPGNADVLHTLFLNLGASPWEKQGIRAPFAHMEISIKDGDLDSASDLIARVPQAIENDVFISWQLSGFPQAGHIADLLVADRRYEAVGYPLFRYQWQAMAHRDLASAEAQAVLRQLQNLIAGVLRIPLPPNRDILWT